MVAGLLIIELSWTKAWFHSLHQGPFWTGAVYLKHIHSCFVHQIPRIKMNMGSCWISAANYSVLLCATETHNPFYPIIIHYKWEIKSEVATRVDARERNSNRHHLWLVMSLHGKFRLSCYPAKKETATKFSKLVISSTKGCQLRSLVLALPSAWETSAFLTGINEKVALGCYPPKVIAIHTKSHTNI